MILSTQSLDELRRSDLLDVIIKSCPTKLFLANPDMDRELYRRQFHLNENEIELISTLIPKQQFLIKTPELAKVANLTWSPELLALYQRPIRQPQAQGSIRGPRFRGGFKSGGDAAMKTLIVSFTIWIFLVPAVAATFLTYRFRVAHRPTAISLSPRSLWPFPLWPWQGGLLGLSRFQVPVFVIPKDSATHKFNSGEKA